VDQSSDESVEAVYPVSEPPQDELFEDEEKEEGRELPPGLDDPSKVSEEDLRPVRSRKRELHKLQ
jgi:chromosome segregation protein